MANQLDEIVDFRQFLFKIIGKDNQHSLIFLSFFIKVKHLDNLGSFCIINFILLKLQFLIDFIFFNFFSFEKAIAADTSVGLRL